MLKNFSDYETEIEKLENKIANCIKGDLIFVNRGVNLDLRFAYLFHENKDGKCKRIRIYGLELEEIQRKIKIRKIYEEQLIELKFNNYLRNEEHFLGDSIKFLPEEKIDQITNKIEDFFNEISDTKIIIELNTDSIKRKIDRLDLKIDEIENKLAISKKELNHFFEGKYELTFSKISKLFLIIEEDENPISKLFLLVENADIEIYKNIERLIERNFEVEFEKIKALEKNKNIEDEINNSKIVYSENKPIEILINQIAIGDEKPDLKALIELYEVIIEYWELQHLS